MVPEHLQQFIPTFDNIEGLRKKILSTLYSIHARKDLDLESLAQEILTSAWLNKTPITRKHITDRYINLWHSHRIDRLHTERSALVETPPLETINLTEARAKIDAIVAEAQLTLLEQHVLYLIFYANETQESTARKLGVSEWSVRQTIDSMLYKLRAAGRVIEARVEGSRFEKEKP